MHKHYKYKIYVHNRGESKKEEKVQVKKKRYEVQKKRWGVLLGSKGAQEEFSWIFEDVL
jgi:hypothetical protein